MIWIARIRAFLLFVIVLLVPGQALCVQPDKKSLPIGLAPHEKYLEIPRGALTSPPLGPVHSLGEWEEAEEVMVLWPNASLISALVARGKVRILADTEADEQWWRNWLAQHGIDESNISFYVVTTDSIWIRDYGPWFIVGTNADFGIIDTWYNRPRPFDDDIPSFVSSMLGVPMYVIGLVHTGGNYYSDGTGNAFSSTLVYTENFSLSKREVNGRMRDFLGIRRYTTGRLSPGITIEHFDTFGKLVAPDTIVFSEFPLDSIYRNDSENMVRKLSRLINPYGTPYKIIRMRMIPLVGSSDYENYRGYINALISNGTLYYPAYGDSYDEYARRVYMKALPGYEIVGVVAMGTEWGDSIHCRTRNLMNESTVFIFPRIPTNLGQEEPIHVIAEIIPSPGAQVLGWPVIYWRADDAEFQGIQMSWQSDNLYVGVLPPLPQGTGVSLYIEAEDSESIVKTAPIMAPDMIIDFTIR